jgi:hypothetical protein
MKSRLLFCYFTLVVGLTAQAGFIYSSTSGTISDGNPAGWSATATVSGLVSPISSVSVNLNISGGYNGDLYAYLSYGGALVPLLNRVGVSSTDAFGYATAGMNVTLAGNPGGYSDIHTTVSPTSGATYAPDGRNISPLSLPSAFNNAGTIGFSAFNTMSPNGTWTIFFADLSSGEQSQLVSWSLNVNGVPEPVNVALGVFAGVFLLVALARNRRVRSVFRQALVP